MINKIEITKTNYIFLRAGFGNIGLFLVLNFTIMMFFFLHDVINISDVISVFIALFLVLLIAIYYSSLACKILFNSKKIVIVTPLNIKTFKLSNNKVRIISGSLNQTIIVRVIKSTLKRRGFILIAPRTNIGDYDKTLKFLKERLNS